MLNDDLTWDKRDASDIKSTTALVEDQSLIPSTYIGWLTTAGNSNFRKLMPRASVDTCTYPHTYT